METVRFGSSYVLRNRTQHSVPRSSVEDWNGDGNADLTVGVPYDAIKVLSAGVMDIPARPQSSRRSSR